MYKIDPVAKKIRELHGLKPRQRMKPTEIWLGITIDEAQRMKDNPNSNMTNRYPFMEMMMSRSDCMRWYKDNGFPVPERSSCVFCPYHSNSEWVKIKKDKPSWDRVVAIDKSLRNREGRNFEQGRFHAYLHPSMKPINEVDFNEDQMDLFDGFGNECEGHCGL